MYKKNKLKYLKIALIVVVISAVYYKWQAPPYKITKENVKSMYCTFWNKDGEHIIQINDSDKDIILSEVSKMRRSGIEGQAGTLGYNFTIEITDGTKFTFYQNSSNTVTLQKNEFFRNIKAPETAKFIKRFISEHNIEI